MTLAALTPAVCGVSGTTISLLTTGNCTIQASQAGNGAYSAATNVTRTFAVMASAQSQTITFNPIADQKLTSGPVVAFAIASSRLPVTVVSVTPAVCAVTGTSVSFVTAGTCTLNASQAGNATYAAALTVAQSFAVGKGDQAISNFYPPAYFKFGTQLVNVPIYGLALTATPGASGNPVTFTASSGGVTTSTCRVQIIQGASWAQIDSDGVCHVTASQAGNSNYNAAPTLSADIVVGPRDDIVTFPPLPPLPFGTAPFILVQAFQAHSALGAQINYSSATPAICNVTPTTTYAASVISLINLGACTVVATTANGSAQASQSFTVTPGPTTPQAITFNPASPVSYAPNATVTLSATGGASGNPIVFVAAPSAVCAINGNVLTLIQTGTCSVIASQAGSAAFAAAVPVTANIAVNQAFARPPTLVTPSLPSAVLGQPYSAGLALGGNAPISNGFVMGLPDGLSAAASSSGYISVTGTPTASGYWALSGSATSAATGPQPQTGPFASSISVKDVVTSGVTVSTGGSHTCVIKDGGVRCWGANANGQLGNSTVVASQGPVVAVAEGGGATAVAAGGSHTCAIVAGGVQCWGLNSFGQLGNGSTTQSNQPVVAIAPGSGVTGLSAGQFHTCAVIAGGVSCWGSNQYRQLGDSTTVLSRTSPVVVLPTGTGVSSVAAGAAHTCALIAGGVSCWGYDSGSYYPVPTVKIATGQGVSVLAAGNDYTCIVDASGGIYGNAVKCWGGSRYPSSSTPTLIWAGGIASVSVGDDHTCAVRNNGAICWGRNLSGQLGNGHRLNSVYHTINQSIPETSNVTQVSAGGGFTCATVRGSVQCWGANGSPTTLGADIPTADLAPVIAIPPGSKATEVTTAGGSTCAVVDGGLSCWGHTQSWSSDCNAFLDSPSPLQLVDSGAGVTDASISSSAGVCFVAGSGLTCFTPVFNGGGTLTSNPFPAASAVTGVGKNSHTCSVVAGGVQCFGPNDRGQLGNGTTTTSASPVAAIPPGSGVTSVSTGDLHTCAVVASGVKCWGANTNGQLGTGSTTDSSIPVSVFAAGSGATGVGAGSAHTCAAVNGGVKCWGSGAQGQLGNGNTAQSLVPVIAIPTGSGATEASAGTQHSCAIADGGVQCWGANSYGQLGNGTKTPSLIPVQAITAGSNVVSLATSYGNTCVVENGGVLCWGDNTYGATGNLATFSVRKIFSDLLASGTASAPTIGAPTTGPGSVTFQIAPPASSGGSPITSYTATCTAPGHVPVATTVDASATSITVSGLDPTVSYACSAAAGNLAGNGTSSATISVTAGATLTSVSFTSPVPFATLVAPASVTFVASPTAAQGKSITKVDFSLAGQPIGTIRTAPYSVTWNGAAPGSYTFTATATDSAGGTAASTVTVTLTLAGETITYLHNDFAGSPVAATDASGAVIWKESYQPYGAEIRKEPASASNRQFFTGKPFDVDTGLSYFGARYYDPVVGRFMGTDPVGFNDSNVHSFNRYGYANQNPYRFVDPDGREPWQWVDRQNPKGTFFRTAGESIGALAAYVEGIATGNNFLAQVALDGMRENVTTSDGVQAAAMLVGGKAGKRAAGETKFTSAGRQAHNEEPLPPGFEREVTIPGTKLRMDGYNKDSKEILEIKPDNNRAVQRGQKQLDRYCEACNKSSLGEGHTSVPVQTYDSSKYLK